MRQESKRFQGKGLGYSKNLEMHKLATAMQLGVLQFCAATLHVRNYASRCAGYKEKPWSLEQVVEMTQVYWFTK